MSWIIAEVGHPEVAILREIGIRTYKDHYADIWKTEGRHGFRVVDEMEFSTDKMRIDMWVMKRDL